MSQDAAPLDLRGLDLGVGAYSGLLDDLRQAGSWPQQRAILLALNLQAQSMRDEVIRVHLCGEQLFEENGLATGLLE